MDIGRRALIMAGLGLTALLAIPRALLAAAWPADAFGSDTADGALKQLFGTAQIAQSSAISLGAPEIAENGAVVPVSVETSLDNVKSVSIVVEKNPRPLAVSFQIPPGTLAEISCRIKMGETSPVLAVVETDSGLFMTSKEVKVTIGGCGG